MKITKMGRKVSIRPDICQDPILISISDINELVARLQRIQRLCESEEAERIEKEMLARWGKAKSPTVNAELIPHCITNDE